MRVIKILDNIVTEVKFLNEGYELGDGEEFSDIGELGQKKISKEKFEDIEIIEKPKEPDFEEKILLEMKYQTALLEGNLTKK